MSKCAAVVSLEVHLHPADAALSEQHRLEVDREIPRLQHTVGHQFERLIGQMHHFAGRQYGLKRVVLENGS